MIQYKKLTKEQAKEFVDEIDKLSDPAFEELLSNWKKFIVDDFDHSYDQLREKTIDTYKKYSNTNDYEIDVRVGFTLYSMLNSKNGFNNVMANDDDIWRYISCRVFPDITHLRYPPSKTDINEGHRINTKRFYLHTRRIWLKTLWWYIHLTWQGSETKTYNVLKKFGTDTISDLYERPGKGYRLKLYRELMKRYAELPDQNSDFFNRIKKKNLVNCRTVEPALTDGGEAGYVNRLINEVVLEENDNAG